MSVRVVSAVRLVQQRSIVVLIGLLVALAGLIEIIRPGAVSPSWVSNILEFAAPLGILAAGQTLVVITGGIDLSVANVATAAAYIMASQAPYGVTRAIVAGLLVGVVVGLVNGVGVAVFRVQPLIMTLAMGLVVTGSLNVYSQAAIRSVPGVPAVVHTLGSGTVLGYVPVSLFLWAPLAVLLILGLRGTGFGRLLYALGDNLEATRLAGVRAWQVLLANYAACGLLSAVAGLVLSGTVNAADLSLATVLLLPSVAAVVIGGTSIFGGSGSYSGTIVGALILTVLNSVPPHTRACWVTTRALCRPSRSSGSPPGSRQRRGCFRHGLASWGWAMCGWWAATFRCMLPASAIGRLCFGFVRIRMNAAVSSRHTRSICSQPAAISLTRLTSTPSSAERRHALPIAPGVSGRSRRTRSLRRVPFPSSIPRRVGLRSCVSAPAVRPRRSRCS